MKDFFEGGRDSEGRILVLRKMGGRVLFLSEKGLVAPVNNIAKIMDDAKMHDLILRALYATASREAIVLPQMFNPPIMLSNIFRLGCVLKKKGYVTAPNRRMGGWHMKLLEPGITYCETQAPVLK